MKQPSIDEMIEKVDSKYTLVVVAARRAREILEQSAGASEGKIGKPVSIALQELNEGKLFYERTKVGIK